MTRRLRSERGAELVEFAFILPLLLLVCVGIIDFGFLFRDYEVLTNAAREGARLSSLVRGSLDDPGTYGEQDIADRVAAYVAGAGLRGTAATTVTPVDIVVGSRTAKGFEVRTTYPHEFLFLGPIAAFFGASFGTIDLTASSTMRQEIRADPAP
jgi:Flp pilus assembly protein TadG